MTQDDSGLPDPPPLPSSGRDLLIAESDTAALKALAHPDRLRMLGLLRFDGPATATSLAKRMGLNSGATSYHLRQLAEHGLIVEAEELGNRRERWWKSRHDATAHDPTEMSGEGLEAGLAMVEAILTAHKDMMARALSEFPALPLEWRKASNVSDYTMSLTAEEAQALKEKLTALLWDAVRQSPAHGASPDPDRRNFTVMLHTFPFSGPVVEQEAE